METDSITTSAWSASLSIITLLSDHLMVLQRSKHSNSPTHLWFHLGRWQHSQLYVPSGHMWSIPVKEMCAISKEGKEKFCIPQEGKERMHLVANCKGYGKTCSCSCVAGNAKANHEQKEFTSLWRSLSSHYRKTITNSKCRFSSSIPLIYTTDSLCGCTFTSWAYIPYSLFLPLSELQ